MEKDRRQTRLKGRCGARRRRTWSNTNTNTNRKNEPDFNKRPGPKLRRGLFGT